MQNWWRFPVMPMWIVALLAVLLSGCASDETMNITQLPISDETVLGLAGDIKDASTQKEAIYYHAREARDTRYQKMYSQSGTKINFAMREVAPGVFVQVMDSIESREAPRFEQPLPNGPSEHPVWRFAEKAIDKGLTTFLWWTGITEGFDMIKHSQSLAAKDPLVVRPEVVQPTIVRTEVITIPGAAAATVAP